MFNRVDLLYLTIFLATHLNIDFDVHKCTHSISPSHTHSLQRTCLIFEDASIDRRKKEKNESMPSCHITQLVLFPGRK